MQISSQTPLWHPCTQMKHHENFPPLHIISGSGVWLSDGKKRYLDGISSWWVNLFGHANKTIAKALSKQAKILEHVLLAGFTHPQVLELSENLLDLLPKEFTKCFYADNGSSGIEIALKMCLHHSQIKGQKRELFLTLENSYHGETLGALSVSDMGLYKSPYSALTTKHLSIKLPQNNLNQELGQELNEEDALKQLEKMLDLHGHNICGFILEPLLQCAGGMNFYPVSFLQKACALVRKYEIDIIFDEVATGFGRLGEMFAFEIAGVVPDYLVLSKGITGGFLPLSVVITNERVFEAFLDNKFEKGFLHSHSYTGNALSCACANATLSIFKDQNIIAKNKLTSNYIAKKLQSLDSKIITNKRFLGMVFAFDIRSSKNNNPREIGRAFYELALKRGVILRPLLNTIYFMPPYIIKKSEIDFVFNVISETLHELEKNTSLF
ncbi:MAG: adenosylmethionine--8-amino-7-oxononanoate transaminase [Helicobacter sp.]|nr:adenosylmethionine--8-amino-7-oxononanoate transaminase [Helicobacter sp.]